MLCCGTVPLFSSIAPFLSKIVWPMCRLVISIRWQTTGKRLCVTCLIINTCRFTLSPIHSSVYTQERSSFHTREESLMQSHIFGL